MKKRLLPYIDIVFFDVNLDNVINHLMNAKNDKINYYYDFFDVRLYSDTINEEDAYKSVYNMTREDYRKKLRDDYKSYLLMQKKLYEEERGIILTGNVSEKLNRYAIGKTNDEVLDIFDKLRVSTSLSTYLIKNRKKTR